MPVKSDAQRRFMYATEEGKTDVSKKVGAEFINASKGLTNLPKKASERPQHVLNGAYRRVK